MRRGARPARWLERHADTDHASHALVQFLVGHRSLVARRIAEAEPSSCALGFWFVCLVSRASANGLPWEVWQVSVDGKSYKQLTKLQTDSPWPAFSKDGRYLAFISFSGLYMIDRQTGDVKKISDEGGHGVMDWYQK